MFSMPVGRVNERRPHGHSGHRRLHEVVGSMDNEVGIVPSGMMGLPESLAWR